MSKELLEIVGTMNIKELKTQLALQCAPLLTGIKISNLLIVEKKKRAAVIRLFKNTPISYYVLFESEDKITFFLYIESKLMEYLATKEVKEAMQFLGYENRTLAEIFEDVAVMYAGYMTKQGEFPHELGLLLGYPAEDVMGFIKHQGKNFLYSGYWKVYGNLAQALEMFQQYNEAKENVIKMIATGTNVTKIVNRYYSNSYTTILA